MSKKEEEWRPISGTNDSYHVSNMGNIRSVDRFVKQYIYKIDTWGQMLRKGVIMKPSTSPNGYKVVRMSINGVPIYKTVHSLVAASFIENKNNFDQINHINGVKTDNRVDNLEWTTASLNQIHAIQTGLVKYFKNQTNIITPNKYAKT